MKKTLVILVSAVLVVSLWGCGESTPAENADSAIGKVTQDADNAAEQAKAATDKSKAATDKSKAAATKAVADKK